MIKSFWFSDSVYQFATFVCQSWSSCFNKTNFNKTHFFNGFRVSIVEFVFQSWHPWSIVVNRVSIVAFVSQSWHFVCQIVPFRVSFVVWHICYSRRERVILSVLILDFIHDMHSVVKIICQRRRRKKNKQRRKRQRKTEKGFQEFLKF